MREAMERAERTPDAWKGHGVNALRVAFLLEQAGGSPGPLPEDAYVTARRWGCTCGNCTDGWLSARMQYRLVALAETNGDMMDEIAKWGGKPDDDLAVQHLPPHVRAGGLTKGVHEDYAKVVRAIGVVLRKRGILGVPTPAAVYAEIPDLKHLRVGCSFGGAGVDREDKEEDEDAIQEDDIEDDFEEDDGDSDGDEEEGDEEEDDESMDEDDE